MYPQEEKTRQYCYSRKEWKREKLDGEIAARIFLNEKIQGKKFPIRRITDYKNVRTVSELSFNGESFQ